MLRDYLVTSWSSSTRGLFEGSAVGEEEEESQGNAAKRGSTIDCPLAVGGGVFNNDTHT